MRLVEREHGVYECPSCGFAATATHDVSGRECPRCEWRRHVPMPRVSRSLWSGVERIGIGVPAIVPGRYGLQDEWRECGFDQVYLAKHGNRWHEAAAMGLLAAGEPGYAGIASWSLTAIHKGSDYTVSLELTVFPLSENAWRRSGLWIGRIQRTSIAKGLALGLANDAGDFGLPEQIAVTWN